MISEYRQLPPDAPVAICVFDGVVANSQFPTKPKGIVYDRLVIVVANGKTQVLEAGNSDFVSDAGPRRGSSRNS